MSVHDIIEHRGGPAAFFRLEPPAPTELERFALEWPAVAALIGIAIEPDAPRVFDPGMTHYQVTADGVSFGQDFWRDLVDRHSRDPAAELDGDVIKSTFPLRDADKRRWSKSQVAPGYFIAGPDRFAAVVTEFGARGNTTVCSIESAAQGAPIMLSDPTQVFFA